MFWAIPSAFAADKKTVLGSMTRTGKGAAKAIPTCRNHLRSWISWCTKQTSRSRSNDSLGTTRVGEHQIGESSHSGGAAGLARSGTPSPQCQQELAPRCVSCCKRKKEAGDCSKRRQLFELGFESLSAERTFQESSDCQNALHSGRRSRR